MNTIEFQSIVVPWRNFHAVSGVGHIKNESDYDYMVSLADHLVESGAANDGHELEDLFLLVCDLIGQYDERHYPVQDVMPNEMLQFLMAQNGLQASDFLEVGSQDVVNAILSGKVDMTVRQIKALSNRFAISPASFL